MLKGGEGGVNFDLEGVVDVGVAREVEEQGGEGG